jgi:hypothetical protein
MNFYLTNVLNSWWDFMHIMNPVHFIIVYVFPVFILWLRTLEYDMILVFSNVILILDMRIYRLLTNVQLPHFHRQAECGNARFCVGARCVDCYAIATKHCRHGRGTVNIWQWKWRPVRCCLLAVASFTSGTEMTEDHTLESFCTKNLWLLFILCHVFFKVGSKTKLNRNLPFLFHSSSRTFVQTWRMEKYLKMSIGDYIHYIMHHWA